ncbi:hypothetical protein EV356DRAFT_536305 [Viridothelium virens]|uniref:Uncharacterized protein n=1 Tax=Viridothelium virens TaxID=1048519 RepID=A0A6A6GXG0_VIRVR|nr:hypothetical protein EV356DRAFT_536305 [Viridothelium virens]
MHPKLRWWNQFGVCRTTFPPLIVYLNALVYVREIDLTVTDPAAKANLDAQILQIPEFSFGVDVPIDELDVPIQNVPPKSLIWANCYKLELGADGGIAEVRPNSEETGGGRSTIGGDQYVAT